VKCYFRSVLWSGKVWKRDAIFRIKVPIFFRGVEWCVGFPKTDSQKKWLIFAIYQRIYGFSGNSTIKVSFIRNV